MFPDVRHLIAAVVASVVALSCGFAMFATFRVNHEPLSRLAAGAAPLQLAGGNPTPGVAMPMPADSFGNRFPLKEADSAGASAEAMPRQPEHDDNVEPPSAVAGITATAPATDAAEPAQPAPVAQAPEPDAKPDDVAAAPSELPAITPSEATPATTSTVATEPPPEQPAEPAAPAPTQQANQEPNPESPDTAATAATEPSPPEAHPKAAHRHRVAAKAQRARQARATVQPVSQPPGLGGPLAPPPSRLAARPQRAHQARAIVQPVSQPSGVGGPFVPPPPTNR
jgi:hypothetical protein